jgi:Fe-S cluster assembly iron-binding protein IscA
VDFINDVSGAGFVFNNPNAKAKCGCGKSFC